MPVVLTEVDPRGVATVTLNRPEVHNAYDGAVLQGLLDATAALGADARVRMLLLRGAGRHFQAGADNRGSFTTRLFRFRAVREGAGLLRLVIGHPDHDRHIGHVELHVTVLA